MSTWSPDESVIPVLDAVPEPIDFEDEEPAPITAPGPPPPPPPLSSPIQPSPTTKRAEESEKPSSKPAIDITVDPEQNALPKPDAPITKAKAPANELARPKTPEQLQVQELVKTHRHNHSIDSTGSTATLRGNSNESSPTGLDGYRTAATIPDAGSGGSNSSSPPYRSQHEPLPIALPVPAASGWYPPPGPPSDLSARPRTRRPHSFSAAPKPLVGYDRGTVGEDDITPRAKPHYRRASTSNPYPPPYSSGYEYKPPQDPYQPPFYSHSTYPPQPRLDYEVPYQQIPMATSQYTTPAEQRQDPFQYLEGVSEVTQRPSRKSRRRASSTSAGLASDYNEEYSAVEHSLKIPGVEENDTEEAGGVFVTDTPHYQSDDHRSSSSTAYHSLHSHKRSRSVSTTRSSLHSVDDKPNMIPEEDETDNTTEEAAAEPIAAVNPYTWYPQAAPGNDLVPSSMPAPPPSPPPSLPPSVSPAETGYPLLARAVAGNADFQIYRRFATLNHRVLLHMQDEIAEMGLMLEKIDESPDSGVRNRRGMTSTPGGEQRLQLLGAIAWKLECYSKHVQGEFRCPSY